MIDRVELRELRKLIEEARIILSTTQLPTDRSKYARDLVASAVKQANAMLARPTVWMLTEKQRHRIPTRR